MSALKSLKLFLLLAVVLPATFAIDIRPRSSWDAAGTSTRISGKVDYVIIHHTNQEKGCSTPSQCESIIKSIQTEHRERRGFDDIAYNFLIGGDGNVYEGCGFGMQGTHSPRYNHRSIGIAFIGNFEDSLPSNIMLNSAIDLIQYAVYAGYLSENYALLGHRQTTSTSCPGNQLYDVIKTWPNWKNI